MTITKTLVISGCAIAFTVFGVGCAGPAPVQSYPQGVQERQTLDSQLRAIRANRNDLLSKKQAVKLQTEIDALQREIDQLEVQIAAIEKRITEIDRRNISSSSSGGKNIGPRGGCYTITKSGKKNYGGC